MLPKTLEVAATKLLLDGNKHKLTVLGRGSYAKAYVHDDYPEYVIKRNMGDTGESCRDHFAGYHFGRYCMKNPSDILPATYFAKRYATDWVIVQKRYIPLDFDRLYDMLDKLWREGEVCKRTFSKMFPRADIDAFKSVVLEWYCADEMGYPAVFGKRVQDNVGKHVDVVKAGAFVSKHVRRESLLTEKLSPDLSGTNIMYDSDTQNLVYVDPFCVF